MRDGDPARQPSPARGEGWSARARDMCLYGEAHTKVATPLERRERIPCLRQRRPPGQDGRQGRKLGANKP